MWIPIRSHPLAESLRNGAPVDQRQKNVDVVSLPLQSDVALNLYDFIVRRPDMPAKKYGLRAYDEVILAPMVSQFFRPSLF